MANKELSTEDDLMYVEAVRRLIVYCKAGDINNMMTLISNGASVNGSNQEGETPAHVAAAEGRVPVMKYLASEGARLDVRDLQGQMPIHRGSRAGHVAVVELILSRGGDKEAVDNDRNRPLHLACQRGRAAVVKYLVSRGADVTARNVYGDHPIHLASWEGHPAVLPCLMANGADIEAKGKFGERPLHIAADRGHTAVTQLLLSHGAAVGSRTSQGRQPVHWAVGAGEAEVVELLLKHGADKDAEAVGGWRPLHIAAHAGHAQTLACLLRNGADTSKLTDKGESVKHLAKQNNDGLMLRLLKSKAQVQALHSYNKHLESKEEAPDGALSCRSSTEHPLTYLLDGKCDTNLSLNTNKCLDGPRTQLLGISISKPHMVAELAHSVEAKSRKKELEREEAKKQEGRRNINYTGKDQAPNQIKFTDFIDDLTEELRRQDRYLSSQSLRRVQILPEWSCFFQAAEASARCYLPHHAGRGFDLRREVVGHLYAWPERYEKFEHFNTAGGGGGGEGERRTRLDRLREPGTWPTYECFLAASRVLRAGVKVTYGGMERHYQPVTDQFYAEDGNPAHDNWIHVIWVSAGYYDAVVRTPFVDVQGCSPSSVDNIEYLQKHPDMVASMSSRKPCHMPPRKQRRIRSATRREIGVKSIGISCNTEDITDNRSSAEQGMDYDDKRRLRINRLQLIQDLNIDDVSDVLISAGVLLRKHIQTIQNTHPNDQLRAGALLDLLETRGPRAFGVFRSSLKSNYSWLCDLIDKTKL